MKRIFAIGIAFIVLAAFFATPSMAAGNMAYDVTANFGKIVSWPFDDPGMDCQRVGSVTMQPQSSVGSNNFFYANQKITMELLNSATLCKNIGIPDATEVDGWQWVYYTWNGTGGIVATVAGKPVWDYRVMGKNGADKILLEVNNKSLETDRIVFGHDGADAVNNSVICLNLTKTIYTPKDANYQLVQASYYDTLYNTFSGDQYIATVKEYTAVQDQLNIRPCTKLEGNNLNLTVNADPWSDSVNAKTGRLEIPLCFQGAVQGQAGCGCISPAPEEVCLVLEDTGKQLKDADYNFTISTNKIGVGIAGNLALRMFKTNAGGAIVPVITNRYDINGNLIFGAVTCDEIKRVDFTVRLTGTGTYYIVIPVAYNTCTATTGLWTARYQF